MWTNSHWSCPESCSCLQCGSGSPPMSRVGPTSCCSVRALISSVGQAARVLDLDPRRVSLHISLTQLPADSRCSGRATPAAAEWFPSLDVSSAAWCWWRFAFSFTVGAMQVVSARRRTLGWSRVVLLMGFRVYLYYQCRFTSRHVNHFTCRSSHERSSSLNIKQYVCLNEYTACLRVMTHVIVSS